MAGNFVKNITTKSANYTTTSTDDTILCNASSGGFTIALAVTVGTGKVYTIEKTDSSANVVTVAPASGTIDGQSSVVLPLQYSAIDVQFDGTDYWLI